MLQINNITNSHNPWQSIVVTSDQPVYALFKQVQLLCPDKFSDTFCKIGDMHIEKAFQTAIGDWLEGSGWTDIYSLSGISTAGRVDSFLKSSHIKRTRYAHHVTLKVPVKLQKEAFERFGS